MALNKNVYALRVDIKSRTTNIVPSFVQYDDARLDFQVFDNGRPYDISGFVSVQFAHMRPDGVVVVGSGEITTDETGNPIVRYDYKGSEMHEVGTIITAFSLLDAEGDKVSVHPFRVNIVDDLQDEAVDPANPEYGLLQELIADVRNATQGVADAITGANAATVAAELATAEAVSMIAEMVAKIDEATGKVSEITVAIAESVTATTNAETATTDANAAATLATEAALAANTSATAADTAVTEAVGRANEAITEAEIATQEADDATADAIVATSNAQAVADNLTRVGEYSPVINYTKGNEVGYNGSSYVAMKNVVGNAPVVGGVLDSENWAIRAMRGIDGEGAVSTVNGIAPDESGNVTLDIVTTWDEINDKPTAYPPSIHTHTIAQVVDLDSALAGKEDTLGNRTVLVELSDDAGGLQYKGQAIGGGGSATETTLADAGNYYTATDVEGALQEVGQLLTGARTSMITSMNGILNS